jgi:MoxR-like ATPase
VSVYNQESRDFEFKQGAVFANIVVGDEINRASPKTQSALLECMEEKQVTVDGVTYPLQTPFMVVATQNPIEMEGTYPLPEAQRDRFTARIAMGYPDAGAELAMLDVHGAHDPLHDLKPVSDAVTVRRMIATVRDVHVADAVKQYAVDLVTATRESPDLRLGASPRATLHLLRTARAVAALEGREYVLPDDLQHLSVPVLAHRIIPTAEAQLARRTTDSIVADLVTRLALPTDRQPRSPYDTRQRQQSTTNPYDPRRR